MIPDIKNFATATNLELMAFIRHAAYGDNWHKAANEIELRLKVRRSENPIYDGSVNVKEKIRKQLEKQFPHMKSSHLAAVVNAIHFSEQYSQGVKPLTMPTYVGPKSIFKDDMPRADNVASADDRGRVPNDVLGDTTDGLFKRLYVTPQGNNHYLINELSKRYKSNQRDSENYYKLYSETINKWQESQDELATVTAERDAAIKNRKAFTTQAEEFIDKLTKQCTDAILERDALTKQRYDVYAAANADRDMIVQLNKELDGMLKANQNWIDKHDDVAKDRDAWKAKAFTLDESRAKWIGWCTNAQATIKRLRARKQRVRKGK